MIRIAVYLLCAATSLVCFVMLIRAYRKTRAPMLLWSSIGFALLALSNALLYVDLVHFPELSLELFRSISALAGLVILLGGLIGSAS